MTYFGTGFIKGRSHCRVCASPVCVTCIVVIKGLEKVCTRCHLKQKEEEICTEKALSAICEDKFGLDDSYANVLKLKTLSQKTDALFEAVKKGLDHVMLTLFNSGCSVDSVDFKQNTPLFYAAEGGYLQCIVLLLEKGANINAKNNVGWTPLHAVSWKGKLENYTECAKYLIEMGADVLCESNTKETAGDVAQRCHSNADLVQILKAAEVEVAMREVGRKVTNLLASAPTLKEQQFCRLLSTLLRYIKQHAVNAMETSPKEKKSETEKENPKEGEKEESKKSDQKENGEDQEGVSQKRLCHKCRGPTLLGSSPSQSEKPKADVEPIVRPSTPKSPPPLPPDVIQNLAEIKRLEREKSDWEERCRKLMSSIALSTKDHEKQIEELQNQMQHLKEENENIKTKRDATYENKLAKLRQESEVQIKEMEERVDESEQEKTEVLVLQTQHKLTWIPDDLVHECQISKCRAPFTKTTRKHHCRCCGRVFCAKCSQQKVKLERFGYTKPVRVCNVCYALIDDVIG